MVNPLNDTVTCGTCNRTWSDREHPTPAGRCPFEYEHEDEHPIATGSIDSDGAVTFFVRPYTDRPPTIYRVPDHVTKRLVDRALTAFPKDPDRSKAFAEALILAWIEGFSHGTPR